MRLLLISVCSLLLIGGTSFAETNATPAKVKNGKIVIAQSYCRMCFDARESCILRCNGAGLCIQRCNDDLEDCIEQNCRYRR